MPRKKLIITHEYPYHITARSNNREWFYLPIEDCWEIFSELLLEISSRFYFQTHAFALMENHYHLIGTPDENHPLPKVKEWFQRSANRRINDRAGRINHLFGGPYKASLITNEIYYLHATKYLYRNPVKAGICALVEEYPFSTLYKGPSMIPLTSPITGIESLIPKSEVEALALFNEGYTASSLRAIEKGLRRAKFQLPSRLDRETKNELGLR